MRDSTVGWVLWLAVKDPIFRSAARRNLGIAVAERGFILSNSEMATLLDFWETLDQVSDRRAHELIEGHARLHYAAVLEDKAAREEAEEAGDEVATPRARLTRARIRAANARIVGAPSKVHEQDEFLTPLARAETLTQAFMENRTAWIVRRTEGARGAAQREETAILVAGDDPAEMAQILLPWDLPPNPASWMDGLLAWFHGLPVQQQVLCWSLSPPHPPELGEALAARGFVCQGQPPVMCLDLRDMIPDYDCPGDLTISLVNSPLTEEAEDLPYYSRRLARARYAAGRELPRTVWYYAAWQDRQLVGHCTLNITTGALGVAGLYDVSVVPSRRNQGIGKALVIVAGLKAREFGCHHMLLNASGERIYTAVGFRRLAIGETWVKPSDSAGRYPDPEGNR
jgi:GNAT superfamily N-acetyltransferase